MMVREDYELMELYYSGKLSAEERERFRQRLQNETDFAQAYDQHKEVLSAFKVYGSRKKLKVELDQIQEEINNETSTKVVFINTYGLKAFWKKHMPTMAVAASVALVTVFSSVLTFDYLRSFENRQRDYYQELKRDLDSIKKNQHKMSKAAAAKKASEHKPFRYSGTGFAVASNGYLLTNHHLVENADSVFVESRMEANQRYRVRMVYADTNTDLAVLKIEDPSFKSFGQLPFAFKTNDADLGEMVYTLAFPREDMVYGEGSISSQTGFEGDTSAYQISIPVNPGNSGGPLLDEKGNLIGVITARNIGLEGAAFAVKSRYILDLIHSIPKDSLNEKFILPKRNLLKNKKRPQQIKQLQDLIFNVKVYSNKN